MTGQPTPGSWINSVQAIYQTVAAEYGALADSKAIWELSKSPQVAALSMQDFLAALMGHIQDQKTILHVDERGENIRSLAEARVAKTGKISFSPEAILEKHAAIQAEFPKPIASKPLIQSMHGADRAAKPVNQVHPERVLGTNDKIAVGMNFLVAAMSAVGMWNTGSRILQKDEKGKTHIDFSMVGITLVQGLFTAGAAYLGFQALRGQNHGAVI